MLRLFSEGEATAWLNACLEEEVRQGVCSAKTRL